ncbi:MAG: membrane protein insertase YidC [Gammaproteobacteria bacterium]|nr:membrane protein insertase YidC [Gammaproteobacteria bacterium]
MENQRLFLYASLGFVMLLLWQAWQADYAPRPSPQNQATTNQQPQVNNTSKNDSTGDLPQVQVTQTPETTPETTEKKPIETHTPIRVVTDTFKVLIQPKGGTLTSVKLQQYPAERDNPEEGFELMSPDGPHFFIAQSGLQSVSGPEAPSHHQIFETPQKDYRMTATQDELRVPLTWTGPDGLSVTKTYIFKRNSHLINLESSIINTSEQPWQGRQYNQLQRAREERGSFFMAASYIGGVIYTEEEGYEKIDFDEMRESDLERPSTGGWIAMIQHYFLGAWVPGQEENTTFYSKALTSANRYIIGMYSTPLTIASGETKALTAELYAGPKIQSDLEEIAKGLDLTVDFGLLTVIAKPLFIVLDFIHSWVGNWGFAIIILTMLIKLIFYKLSETSYRSMARMRKLSPKLQALKEKYGNDRQKMGTATMELYKKEKVNPLGGCLPILIQIPVFIALYWVLLESVELRQAPFILWIQDLSVLDPYYVLPVIMGVTMFIQQKLNPAPIDPVQAKVFMILPVAFSFFFAFFPSGLVLYWVVNNTLSIAQQYYITRHVLAEK